MSEQSLWKFGDFGVATKLGAESVNAWTHPAAPGLVVTDTVGESVLLGYTHTITHEKSGYRCAPFYRSLDDAKHAALAIATFGDWTRDGDAITSDAELKRKVRQYYKDHYQNDARRSA